MKNTAATLLMLVLSVVTACAPSVPTPAPTPEPTPTPAWVLATKPDHLVGIWRGKYKYSEGWLYERVEADGTIWYWWEAGVGEGHGTRGPRRFWFEDGVYYAQSDICDPIGSYRAYLKIELFATVLAPGAHHRGEVREHASALAAAYRAGQEAAKAERGSGWFQAE
jgi:hypothetical protein